MASLGVFSYRLMRAAMLDSAVFEEVESDATATPQACATVILASVAAGIGAGGWHGVSFATFAVFSIIALALWVAWALLVLQTGSRLVPEPQTRANAGELLRTIGFAAAPGLFQVFAAFHGVTTLVFGLTVIWMLAAMVVAVRQALDYRSTTHALAVCGISWAIAIGMPVAAALMLSRTAS